MSEHTKGPWTIELTGDNQSKDGLIISHPNASDFNAIRSIGRLWAYGTEKENEANARLVAASPDLLETCKAWAKYDSESFDKSPCPDLTLKIYYRDEARKLTKIALAKAEPS